MFRLLIIMTFLPSVLWGQKPNKRVKGIYVGWWGTTQWTYIFDTDTTFTFNTAGHFGFTNTVGQYHISGDTLFLISNPKKLQKDTNALILNDTLMIEGDSCIIDLSLGYDYCKSKNNEINIHQSRQRKKGKSEARKPDD